MAPTTDTAPVRLAEIVAALSLGIDLGFSQPMEHVLRQCLIALRVAELIGLDDDARAAVYYSALLVNVGCHSEAHEQAKWFGNDIALKASKFDYEPGTAREALGMVRLLGAGGSPLHRIRTGVEFAVSGRHDVDDMLAQHATLARQLADQLDLPVEVGAALACSYERWDGKGWPERSPVTTPPSHRGSCSWRNTSRWPTAPAQPPRPGRSPNGAAAHSSIRPSSVSSATTSPRSSTGCPMSVPGRR